MSNGASKIKIVLMASLYREAGGRKYVEVEARTWKEALKKLREEYPGLKNVINENGEPEAGYIVFVDGVDYRIAGDKPAKEVVVLPVNHGGYDPELLFVDWNTIEGAVERLSERISTSNWRPDVVVGILRGGIIPARLLADRLEVEDIGVIEVKFYKGIGETREKPYLRQPLLLSVVGRNVLIVDDISDSGLTLQLAATSVSLYNPRSLKTASLFIKPWTKMIPDFYAFVTEKWVVFPWERTETEKLLRRSSQK